LHRTGILARIISENTDHKVTWWTSTFNHFTKEHVYNEDTIVNVNENLKMITLKGKGYKRNISLDRISDHQKIAQKFRNYIREEQKPDIIVASFPTLYLCQACVRYGKENNVPVIIDYRDMWPEVFVEIVPMPLRFAAKFLLFSIFRKTEKVFRNSTGIIGITDEFLQMGLKKAKRLKNPSDNVFPLAYMENQFTNSDYEVAKDYWKVQGISDSIGIINICFFGTFGYQFDLETVLQTASALKNESVNFILCGTGDKLEKLKTNAFHIPNVKFPGYMSAAQIKALMDISHIGICPYVPKQAFLNSIPGKAIEYFSSGLYVISTLGDGILGKYLVEKGFGANYTAYDPLSLKQCIEKAKTSLNDSTRNSIRNYYRDHFDAKLIYSDYLIHLENIVNSHAPVN